MSRVAKKLPPVEELWVEHEAYGNHLVGNGRFSLQENTHEMSTGLYKLVQK